MRSIIATILFLSFAFRVMSGDSQQTQSDADFRQKIVGTWIVDIGTTNDALWAKGYETYSSDGCFVAEITFTMDGKTDMERAAGRWQIINGILLAANTNVAAIKAGTLERNYENCKLIRIDDYQLVHYLFNKPMKNPGRIADVVTRKRLK
jgi:hypothetical protein